MQTEQRVIEFSNILHHTMDEDAREAGAYGRTLPRCT